jgi:hypothetical protein
MVPLTAVSPPASPAHDSSSSAVVALSVFSRFPRTAISRSRMKCERGIILVTTRRRVPEVVQACFGRVDTRRVAFVARCESTSQVAGSTGLKASLRIPRAPEISNPGPPVSGAPGFFHQRVARNVGTVVLRLTCGIGAAHSSVRQPPARRAPAKRAQELQRVHRPVVPETLRD